MKEKRGHRITPSGPVASFAAVCTLLAGYGSTWLGLSRQWKPLELVSGVRGATVQGPRDTKRSHRKSLRFPACATQSICPGIPVGNNPAAVFEGHPIHLVQEPSAWRRARTILPKELQIHASSCLGLGPEECPSSLA